MQDGQVGSPAPGPTRKQLAVEDFYRRPWRDALRWCLLQRGMTQQQIADELKERRVGRSSIAHWVRQMRSEGSLGSLDGRNGHYRATPEPVGAAS